MGKIILLSLMVCLMACQKDPSLDPDEWINAEIIGAVRLQNCSEGHLIKIKNKTFFTTSPILELLNRKFPLCDDAPCPKVPVMLRADLIQSSCTAQKRMILVLEIKFR
jgi:hypothetical protein